MRKQRSWNFQLVAAALCCFSGTARSAEPVVISVEKIWDKGSHNAFTDLIRWQGKWYCIFRESEAHVGGDGVLRLLESADGKAWTSAAVIAEAGIDLRDPKLSITPDNRLMIVAGGSVYQGTKTLKGRRPRVCFSNNGREWTAPIPVLSEGEWLWRVTWHDGKAYGISYNPPSGGTNGSAEWALKLFVSDDGVKYSLLRTLGVSGHPNESTIRVLPDGEMIALVRREATGAPGWIGTSRPPYTDWKWNETNERLGGPNFIRLPDGSLIAASRSFHDGTAKTALARMTRDSYKPILTLPSSGDNSYPGLVWHDGLLWISYYSTHEGKTSIYLAKVKLSLEPESIESRLEPFVDDFLLDRLSGSTHLQVQRPEPRELVFTADKSWEGNTSAYFTLFQDGERYRMYYRGAHWNETTKKASHREVTCYAESRDGIHWIRPELGLFEFDGSKQNNIIWDGPGTHNFTPFLDMNPACARDARYKALAGGSSGLIPYKSSDGIHWEKLNETPVITKGAFDSQNLAFWDAYSGTYREYHRQFRSIRDIMTGTSMDFLHWSDPSFIVVAGAPRQHLYTNAVMPYFRAPHILIGFPTRFLPKFEQVEPTFMASRDGRNFVRYEDPVIPRTAPKDRDGNRSNYMTWGLLNLPGHDGELSVYGTEAYYSGPGSRVRRFAYRLDGFVSLQTGVEGGEAVTRPVRFQGKQLVLNARTSGDGQITVEVQDADGKPIEGYGASDCRPIRGDSTAAVVTWSSGGDVSTFAGKTIRLRFVARNADLFSFRFE